ncbi:MAG: hypothetical protein E5Y73_35160 [Mesorhizobium sp.]|uniref:hypothetical protein n=1 Tax=Mesorhizobium sp. TaxID=1871066 RepID=UPI0012179EB1|nr:hypothetical protein [Mesorhizobium sp.]TIL84037.1 MAG: hypothetical protein E5Y73_35160 [Mesorhizobium sp.]
MADLRSQGAARIVNRNEPFGSILEAANSHFCKLLTFLISAAAGQIDVTAADSGRRKVGFQPCRHKPAGFAGGVAPHGYDVAFMPTVSRPA